ncbi:acetoacetate decarboxylase family protein [Archaeoglobus neptunius]|uniref:acetoacetate decarboxylase family protein n=1 Tax=Archaeoglobus neptunius TaxID=2798580 RepID=UPI0019254422|nr:acetoacetate decarboxylase family protein [Archaeoglobus neptunius]
MAWTPPYSKSGKSALVASGPWNYAMDAIAAHFKCESEQLDSILPEGFRAYGEGYVYFAEIVSQSPNFPELNYEAPGLVQYKELAVFLKVEFKGRKYAYCPFMYVDNDVSLLRGFVAGFPKKLAVIDITKQHPLLKQEKMGGVAMRAGYPLIKLVVSPKMNVNSNPLDEFGKWILYRFAEPMEVREFVEITPDIRYYQIAKGDADIKIFGGINDELETVNVKEVLGGYRFSALLKVAEIKKLDQ